MFEVRLCSYTDSVQWDLLLEQHLRMQPGTLS
jgi:hypothetical protein